MNLWILSDETLDKKGFIFINAIRDHKPLVLELIQMRHIDPPDKLVLRGQVILRGDSVIYEPFHPKPLSASIPSVGLRMFLEGYEDETQCEFTSPSFEDFRFCVKNIGQQTVRDYRNTVLIPKAFRRPSSQSYLGNLSAQGETIIEAKEYIVYGNFAQTPIYKNELIRIGQLILQADPGNYTFLWKIRCDDGVFPGEDNYGQIQVRVVPLGGRIDDALHNVLKSP